MKNPLIPILSTLALSLSAFGQSSPSITLEIPVEAAGHSFQFFDMYSGTTLMASGRPFYDALTEKFLIVGVPPSDWAMPILIDDTLGLTLFDYELSGGFNFQQDITWPVAVFENGNIGYAIHEGRHGHAFAVIGSGFAFPVSPLSIVGVDLADTDGNPVFSSLGFFNAHATIGFPVGATVLVDLTTNQQATGTDLRNNTSWTARTVPMPTRGVTFSFGMVPPGYVVPDWARYTLHTSSGSLQNMVPSSGGVIDDSGSYIGERVTISGQVGILEEYWLTQNGTSNTTPHYFMGLGGSGVTQGVAPLVLPQSQLGQVTFTIGEDHFGEDFRILQGGSLISVTPNSGAGQGTLTTWNENGNAVNYTFAYYNSDQFALNAPWELVSINSSWEIVQYYGQITDLRDGFAPYNPTPPVGQISVSVPESRRASLIAGNMKLRATDGSQWLVSPAPGFEQPGNYFTMWSSISPAANITISGAFDYIPCLAQSSTFDPAEISLHDATTGETTPFGTGGSGNDFTFWATETTLALNLPASRWNDNNLSVITASGAIFGINRGALQGLWSGTGQGASFISYGYFDATSTQQVGADWWVFTSSNSQGNAEISDRNGIGTENNNTLLGWMPPGFDSDSDGLPDWYEYIIGTSDNNADSDADGISDYIEAGDGTNPNSAAPILTVTAPVGAVWLN